ncbi:MAG: DUF411 domain-containing protein [Gammaproteobacteria bacterium]
MHHRCKRRRGAWTLSLHLALFGLTFATGALAADLTVYKRPTCGCCKKWVDHMRAAGFTVTVNDVKSVEPVKREHAVPPGMASCHTALVEGYVVEGHVPVDVVQRLLKERPKVSGIAVPGMPMGSPGMEGPRQDSYEIYTFDADGHTAVYERR